MINIAKGLFRPRAIVFHHSECRDRADLQLDDVVRYHRETKKWRFGGYHFWLEKVEGVFVFSAMRPLAFVGAHAPGWPNREALGICVCGDFSEEEPGPEIYQALAPHVLGLMIQLQIPESELYLHRQVTDTTCPGLFSLEKMKAALAAVVPDR